MQLLNGTILDATALIDFRCLNEWGWLQQHYSPLYVAQELLDSDQLEPPTRQAANQYLTPLTLSTEEMFASFLEFSVRAPLLSVADRSTIANATISSNSERASVKNPSFTVDASIYPHPQLSLFSE
jgi:hypothetical protein